MKNLALYAFLILLLNTINSNSQPGKWEWAKGAIGESADEGTSIAYDIEGNILITGFFTSPSIEFGSKTLENAGASGTVNDGDLFVTKYDISGKFLWARSAGGSNNDRGYGIATDKSGNIYVTGYFMSPTITFGSVTLTNNQAANSDLFIVKYDPNGTVLWARSGISNGTDVAYAIAVDELGNILVTGSYSPPSITFGKTTLSSTSQGKETFVVKYSPDGVALWAKSSKGALSDITGRSITSDLNGNVYVTGTYKSSTFTAFDTVRLKNRGEEDIFVVKYSPEGQVLWARADGGSGRDLAKGIDVDINGNVYITGFFTGVSTRFGSVTLKGEISDIFIVKYNNNGEVLWARSATGAGQEEAKGIAVDANGNAFITGYYWDVPVTFDKITLTNNGGLDLFVTKYDPNGSVLWSTSAGGNTKEVGNAIAVDDFNGVYVTGTFGSSTVAFGSTVLSNSGNEDVVMAMLQDGSISSIGEAPKDKNLVHLFQGDDKSVFYVSGIEGNHWNISLYSLDGKCLYYSVLIDSIFKIESSLITKGVYIIQLQKEGKVKIGKVIIE